MEEGNKGWMWRRQGVITGQFNPSSVCDVAASIQKWQKYVKGEKSCVSLEAGVATLESSCKVSSVPDENQTQETEKQMTYE